MRDTFSPITTITGELVVLGPVRRDLVPLYHHWANDWHVTRTRGIPIVPLTLDEAERRYGSGPMLWSTPNTVDFLVYVRSTMRPIGLTAINDIDHHNGTGEFAIVIGERDEWGRGYGTEVARLMLEYAFVGLGLHNVMLMVLAVNAGGIKAYERAGFRVIGRRRGSFRMGGEAVDDIYMDCLSTEFEPRVLAALLPGPLAATET